jgi:hypothetical protein
MANTILIKRSGNVAAAPTGGTLALGELAINYTDGNLFYKDNLGAIQVIASKQFVSVTGNITGGNVLTGGLISATGNVTGGNIITAGAISGSSVSSSGNVTGGNLNASGLSLSSNVLSALNSTSNITTTANISANYFIGNGSLLTGIDATSIQNGNSNVKVYANGNVSTSVTGVANVLVVTTTGLDITGLISANGNITGGNINTGIVSATGNVEAGNLNAAGLSLSSNVVSNLNVTTNITGGNVESVGLLKTNNFSITGNVTGNLVPSANATYDLGAAGAVWKDLYLSGTSIKLGPQTITANATAVSVGASTDLSANNITAVSQVSGATVSAWQHHRWQLDNISCC